MTSSHASGPNRGAMPSCRRRPRDSGAIVLAVALLAAVGCAHTRRPEPAQEPDHEAPGPPPQHANLPPDTAPEPEPAPPPPGRLDPSEEITPEELATLPDPVPRGAGSASSQGRSQAIPAPDTGSGTPGGDSGAPAPSEGLWRVQIYASERRSEAERVGRSAASRLGERLFVEREGGVYKVRLGAFTSEAQAQELRDRAVRAGYPGAFRTRAAP